MARRTVDTSNALAERTPDDIRAVLAANEIPEYAIEQLVLLHAYAAEKGAGFKALSHVTGISHGVLSQMYSANYPGNYILRARKIEKFLKEESKRILFGGRDEFVETSIARGLWVVFDKTRYNRRIQPIQSPEQLGKSRAAREYAKRNNSGRTVMVTLQPGGTSNPFGVFLRDLAMACGIKDIRGRKILDLRYDVREALAICDLVIIDELHQVEHWSDKATRDFFDFLRVELHADGERGVVLIATNSDVRTLLQSFRRRTRYNLGQLLGRMCNQVIEIQPDEIPPEDVAILVNRYYKPGKAMLDKLYDLACRPKLGHFGLLLDILNRAWTDCKVEGKPMTDKIVMAIYRDTTADITANRELYA